MKLVLRPSFDRLVRRVGVVLSAFGLTFAAAVLFALPSFATGYTWSSSIASGDWTNPTSWGGSGYPSASSDTAKFSSATAVVNLDVAPSIASVADTFTGSDVKFVGGKTLKISGASWKIMKGAKIEASGTGTKVWFSGDGCKYIYGSDNLLRASDGGCIEVRGFKPGTGMWDVTANLPSNMSIEADGEGSLVDLRMDNNTAGIAGNGFTFKASNGGEIQYGLGRSTTKYCKDADFLSKDASVVLDDGSFVMGYTGFRMSTENSGQSIELKGALPLLNAATFVTIGNSTADVTLKFVPEASWANETTARVRSGTTATLGAHTVLVVDGSVFGAVAGTKIIPLVSGKTELALADGVIAGAAVTGFPSDVTASLVTNADDNSLAANTLYLKLVSSVRAVEVPTVEGVTYDGQAHTPVVAASTDYTVTTLPQNVVDAGEYDVVLTLSAAGTAWADDGTTGPKTLKFVISRAANGWTTEPSLSKTAWELAEDPATVNAGAALSETAVVVTYDEGETEMPLTVGDHTAVFTVEESQNYLRIEKAIGYKISKNANAWLTEPGLTKTTWAFDEEPGEVVDGEAKYGDVDVIYDDDRSLVDLPTDLGEHTVKFAVDETDTYTGLEKVVNYTVTKKQHKWTVPPKVPATVNIEDGVNFPMPVAEPGVEVKAYFDGNPEKTELTEIAVGESHTVTYAIAGDDDWDEVKQTFTFKGVYKAIVDPENPSTVFGYRIPKLGANQDEVALVFTNTAAAMTYNLPSAVSAVSYLVVGGGGGGAGWIGSYACGGGGAGGVVSNSDVAVSGGSISVVVGVGGAGCTSGSGSSHNSKSGTASQLVLGDQPPVIAYGGGKGGCAAAGVGGEGYGSGGGGGSTLKNSQYTSLAGGAANPDGQGHAGGAGYSGTYRGGGGGGAGEDGWTPTSEKSGKGGDGIVSDITGDDVWYAGGGGGGSHDNGGIASPGGKGGGGAGGTCKSNQTAAGHDATYFGGGGGSAKGNANGGSGYQGVVIVRYVEPAGVVMVPTILPKTYTGETLVADVPVNVGYTVTENDGGTDVDDYDVVLTLNDGYHWDGGSTEPTNLAFTITQAQNEWTVEPSIDKTTWLTTDGPGGLTAGETKFGTPTATISKDGGDAEPFDGTLPTAAGRYVIAYMVETSGNWIDPEVTEKSVEFEIVSGDVVPPFTVTKGEMTTVVGEGQVDLSVGYAVHCDVESDKKVDIYAYIAEDGADTTNEVKIAEDVALDAVGTGTVSDLKPGVTYWVALGGKGGDTITPTTEFTEVTMTGPATDLAASVTFTNDPKEFVITGSVTPGLGTTTVYVRWSLNSDALDQSAAFPFQYGDAGAFTQKVAYAELTDTLTWDVAVSNSFASTTHGDLTWDDSLPVTPKDRYDSSAVTYTWTGNGGDNLWQNIANWSANKVENFGYPDSGNATAKFEKSWAINLGGGSFELAKGTGLAVGEYDYMVFSNGTIYCDSAKDHDFGAASTTVVFKDATLNRDRLSPVANATVTFEGAARFTGMVRPWGASGEKMNFLNGENITIGKILCGGAATGREMTISNATVTLQGSMASAYGSATFPVTLQNGPDRQARLVSSHADGWDFVQSPYTLTIPEQPYATPYFQAMKVRGSVNSSPTFKIDVTNWKRGKRVPILTFTSSASGAATQYGGATVKVYENGVDVTAKRHARLEWDADTRTLYYKQDAQGGFALIVK